MTTNNPLPRELTPGLFWLGECLFQTRRGETLHSYNSVYLLCGDRCSLLVEAGHPQDLDVILAQLDGLLAAGAPELRYVFTTHQETPHSSGVGRLLQRYPEATLVGDVRDFHLIFPEHESRFVTRHIGDSIDLGGREFVLVDSVIRDYVSTLWGFDTASAALFSGDGFAYSHYHQRGHCGKTAEEAPSLHLPDMIAVFAEAALYWTRYADLEPYIARLDDLVFHELGVELVAPTHGLPILDVAATLPKIYEGLRLGGSAGAEAKL